MSPGKEDNDQLLNDICVRDVEVMLQRGDVDVAVDILLHILLPSYHRAPAHLKPHLSCRIVDEASKSRMHVVRAWSTLALLLRRLAVAISALLAVL